MSEFRALLTALTALYDAMPDSHARDPQGLTSTGQYCNRLGRRCPPYCAGELGGCDGGMPGNEDLDPDNDV